MKYCTYESYFGINFCNVKNVKNREKIYINHSHPPLNYKINVINNLVKKGTTLAHKSFHKENIQKIKSTLFKKNYSHAFLNFVIKKRLNLFHREFLKRTLTHAKYLKESHTHTYAQHTETWQVKPVNM